MSADPERTRCRGRAILAAFSVGVIAWAAPVRAKTLICDINRIRNTGLYEHPFELRQDATVRVRAVGTGPYEGEPMLAYAWILDASTRRPVWIMERDGTRSLRRKGEDRVFQGDIDLRAGRYIAYYSALGRHYSRAKGVRLLDKLIGSIHTTAGFWMSWDSLGDPRRWGLELEALDDDDGKSIVRDWDGVLESDAFIHLAPLGNDAYESVAFRAKRAVDATILCLAEFGGSRGAYADRAWIADALSGRTVWQTNQDDAEPGGGADKNHAFNVLLRLDPGEYVVTAVTDGSHAWRSWNGAAPLDPQAWGISVLVDDIDGVERISDPRQKLLITAIDRAESASFVRRAFRVSTPITVRVEGTGELDPRSKRETRFLDYGWIEHLPEGTVVWSMERREGRHAGGHPVNRTVSDVLELDVGTYMLSYLTDAHHAYGDWGFAPPDDPTAWGVRLYATSNELDRNLITEIEVREADPTIISLAPTGDGTHRKQLMTLPRTYELRVICLGEGLGGEMYDYGWIEDAETGRVVWTMQYEGSRHAGGANKNRYVDTIVTLSPGRYRVHYVTDDSHSFEDWNEPPPRKPQLWGISIYPSGTGPNLHGR